MYLCSAEKSLFYTKSTTFVHYIMFSEDLVWLNWQTTTSYVYRAFRIYLKNRKSFFDDNKGHCNTFRRRQAPVHFLNVPLIDARAQLPANVYLLERSKCCVCTTPTLCDSNQMQINRNKITWTSEYFVRTKMIYDHLEVTDVPVNTSFRFVNDFKWLTFWKKKKIGEKSPN